MTFSHKVSVIICPLFISSTSLGFVLFPLNEQMFVFTYLELCRCLDPAETFFFKWGSVDDPSFPSALHASPRSYQSSFLARNSSNVWVDFLCCSYLYYFPPLLFLGFSSLPIHYTLPAHLRPFFSLTVEYVFFLVRLCCFSVFPHFQQPFSSFQPRYFLGCIAH